MITSYPSTLIASIEQNPAIKVATFSFARQLEKLGIDPGPAPIADSDYTKPDCRTYPARSLSNTSSDILLSRGVAPQSRASASISDGCGSSNMVPEQPFIIEPMLKKQRLNTSEDCTSTSNSSTASRLPSEILDHIYSYLAPADFNSARHSCRSWFISSLNHTTLQIMLMRGGWSLDLRGIGENGYPDVETPLINNEWLLSKRLARECALGSQWTGNGLSSQLCFDIGGECSPRTSPFRPISEVDFTALDVSYNSSHTHPGLDYTFSNCGQYLMMAQGWLVWVYQLNYDQERNHTAGIHSPGSISLLTSVVCPRKVVACSMDTSSGRHAIAILLEGRMGMVCSLRDHVDSTFSINRRAGQHRSNSPRQISSLNHQSASTRSDPQEDLAEPPTVPVWAAQCPVENPGGEDWQDVLPHSISQLLPHAQPQSYGGGLSPGSQPWQDILPHANPRVSRVGESVTLHRTAHSISVDRLHPTFYQNLCSLEDAPRSVAICPQRRCVAFGCGTGIELHWVDALTGQDLNRYFPVVAPSDHLYFLPPRNGVNSVKKLRLISSEAPPTAPGPSHHEKHTVPRLANARLNPLKSGFQQDGDKDLAQRLNIAWRTNGYNASDWLRLGTKPGYDRRSPRDNSDHYRAIPLSDGYHVLFIDPETSLLCLGSDAPVGGPTKLLRKIWLRSPEGRGAPLVYAAGSNLT